MLTEQRFEIICRLVNERKSITVTELKDILETSESTVRRDITALHKAGRLIKVFGGAVALEQAVLAHEDTVAQKLDINPEAKRVVARYAAALVEPDDFVYLDAGTATGYLLEYLTETRATYVTNAVSHARRLAAKGLKVILIGGELKDSTEAIVGSVALQMVQQYHFSKGFFGTNAINRKAGFTTPDPNEAMVKQQAMEQCQKKYVLADYSKFNRVSPVTFAAFTDAEILTEDMPEEYRGFEHVTAVGH